MRFVLIALSCLVLVAPLAAEMLSFDSPEEWALWEKPFGLTQVSAEGQLQLVKFRKDINLTQNAHLFKHKTRTKGDDVPGGLWQAGSNPADAPRIIDGDLSTFWQPDPDDAREDWFITIDLGRAALAREIRLTFPDQEGARPFRQFRVFATSGVRISASEDLFLYRQIYSTTRPNTATELVIPLSFSGRDSTMVVDADLDFTPEQRDQYRMIQYIQIISEEQNEDAALAEIEVIGIGDNIALGTHLRGGFVEGDNTGSTPNLFDADLNTNHTMTDCRGAVAGWADGGTWFRVDLGATFFVDEMFIYSMQPDEGTLGFTVSGSGPGHTVNFSDGTPATGTTPPVDVPETVDYTEAFTHIDPNGDRLLYLRYLFKPRKARYMLFHATTCFGWGVSKWGEMQLFSPGHPAQVKLQSTFINLGSEAGDGRPKVIKALHWDADLPPGAQLQLRSRSGNALSEVYTFHNKIGEEVTEEKWTSSPKVLRGAVDTSSVVGEDWNAYSNTYQSSGESFKSESPRRFVQLEMILSTDDPQVAPTVNSVSVEFEDALVQGARGSVNPRQASPNQDTEFTYTLWPEAKGNDSGFDRLRFVVHEPVDLQSLSVMVGADNIAPTATEMRGDSLFIDLPQAVGNDSLQVSFTTRLLQNASVFALDLGSSERPGLWQSVEAAERRSNVVMLPELTGSGQLISELQLASEVLTPNGDGTNDQLEVRFVIFKTEGVEARVEIFDLAGRRVAGLAAGNDGSQRFFSWDGRTTDGTMVEPGVYILRVDLGADAGDDTALRTIAVAY
ncbi:MAG: hypothetical protein HOL51_17495 [Gemmatimonadetes bacterium]|jgi:hypothetical protein|nr:hypothetical protein [Gemmatimonadota bacterium]MBT5327909.1 hypothetical protein [Gemmatimonadota bacterium]MBT5450579.1 hypothetical protein [Gemmatimonadota bacterium]MBT5805121.1 hypothetical protein [Gemmatimonadota bacterium]MBT6619406.1 hypothetical protein [Gemmatimonadota bacterium]